MIKLRKILYTTDFGDSAVEALRYAAMLAGEYDSELHMLHIISMFNEGRIEPSERLDKMEEMAEEIAETLRQRADRRMDSQLAEQDAGDIKVFKHIERGLTPHVEVLRVAEEIDADLIVMGTYGRGPVAHLLFGSTAEQVVRFAGCPVLTVRHHAERQNDFRQIRNILLPTDFSEYSKKALPYALSFASRYKAKLHVLHVFEQRVHPAFYILDKSTPFDLDQGLRDRALDALDEFVYQDLRYKVDFTCEVASGKPFIEIINYAKHNEIDLIVTATHGLTGLEHMLIGSTTEHVVRKAPCPVLSIKDPEHEFIHP